MIQIDILSLLVLSMLIFDIWTNWYILLTSKILCLFRSILRIFSWYCLHTRTFLEKSYLVRYKIQYIHKICLREYNYEIDLWNSNNFSEPLKFFKAWFANTFTTLNLWECTMKYNISSKSESFGYPRMALPYLIEVQ